ncbi:Hypothetical predicted protein [Octopus vulgaris]|uniref:Uncharacterized protein n=1 Tax=Octopus vulgaris TaxID=6645 RepID=A0AA36AYE5_OCTVU|nr:Hypothetical predicted protein [Octopus vulgaris]
MMFSSCYGNLCSQPEYMVDLDVLNEELHKTTGLNECKNFTEDNIGHIDSRDDDRKNATDNHIGNVRKMIQIDVKEGQNHDQLNDDDETAKHDYSKDEKTKRYCVCEVADDKKVYVNNRLKCKTLNGEKSVSPDNHPFKLNKRSAKLDNSLPKKDRESFAMNKNWKIKGGKINSISKINPHRINTATEMIQNSKTNLTYSLFYIPKCSRKEQLENNDEISSIRRPFEECQNFTTHEPHLSMSSCEYSISLVDMSYKRSVRKTAYPPRRISENKVSAPLRRQRFSYPQNNNNSASPKSKQGRSRSQQYTELEDLEKLAELVAPRSTPDIPVLYSPQYAPEYYVDINPYSRRGTRRRSRKSLENQYYVVAPQPYQCVPEYHLDIESEYILEVGPEFCLDVEPEYPRRVSQKFATSRTSNVQEPPPPSLHISISSERQRPNYDKIRGTYHCRHWSLLQSTDPMVLQAFRRIN